MLPARVERLGGARFRLTIEPPLKLPDSGSRTADAAQLMGAVNATLERWIRERPEQWRWIHWRWRERPDGSSERYGRAELAAAFAAPLAADERPAPPS